MNDINGNRQTFIALLLKLPENKSIIEEMQNGNVKGNAGRNEVIMSLQFVLGPSGAGKTRYIYEQMIRQSLEHPEKRFLLLVPEQATMEAQRDIITMHPGHYMTNIDVLSFNRLAYRVFEELSVETLTLLDDMGKSMVLRKVAGEKKDELRYYRRHLGQSGFINQLKSLLSEMSQYGVSPGQLNQLKDKSGSRILSEKLSDFTLIYEHFLEYIKHKFTTAEGLLDLCCNVLHQSEKINGSQLYLDGFTGFTPVQYRILSICMNMCSEVFVSATLDFAHPIEKQISQEELFYMSHHMISRLLREAQKENVARGRDICLDAYPPKRFLTNPSMAFLEKHLYRYGKHTADPQTPESQGIFLYEGKNPLDEIRFAGSRIRTLISEQGLRYRDMAVITGDLAAYGREVKKQFALLDIPFFMDDKKSILANPLVELIRSAVEIIAADFSYESVFRYLKTGLAFSYLESRQSDSGPPETPPLSSQPGQAGALHQQWSGLAEGVDRLENYVRALGIRGYKRWNEEWERIYRGGERLNLTQMNELRKSIMAPFAALREELKKKDKKAGGCLAALTTFLETLELEKEMARQAEALKQQGQAELSQEYAQVYPLAMEMFGRFDALLGDETISLNEFAEILDAGFGEIKVGAIPAVVDRVLVGDITRTRLDQIKVLFFVGVNEGIVPGRKENHSLLSDEDRAFLAAQEIELAPSAKENGLMQRFYLYLMLMRPSQELYLTWSLFDGTGKEARPSGLVGKVRELFPGLPVLKAKDYSFVPNDHESGLMQLAEFLADREDQEAKIKELLSLLKKQPEVKQKALQLVEARYYAYTGKGIGKAAAKALYGDILQGSVTRLELYGACAYAHFLRYGLELEERREYELGVVDVGNLLHQTLDICFARLKEQGRELFSLSQEEQNQLVEYGVAKGAKEYGNTILFSSSRNAYLVERMKRITQRTLWALGEQLKKGDFRPAGFEVEFNAADNLRAMKIPLSGQQELHLRGRIDRLDLYEDDRSVQVKIIDYKSGSTKFQLSDLYYGLKFQLVVYMDAAMEMQEKKNPHKEVIPGGLFYYQIQDPVIEKQPDMDKDQVEQQVKKQLRMSGLVNSDLETIRHLDHEIEGESDVIPVALKSGMIVEAKSSVASRQRFQFLRDYVKQRCQSIGREILSGEIALRPYQRGAATGCDYCPYHAVCGFDRKTSGHGYRKLKNIGPEQVWEEIIPKADEASPGPAGEPASDAKEKGE